MGTSSPSTMWSTVMIAKAMAEATVWVATASSRSGSQWNRPSTTWASAGSPAQPRPREARVIPSWVAEM